MAIFHPAFPMKVYASKTKMAMTILIGFALIAMMGLLTYGAYRTTNPEEGATVFKYLGRLPSSASATASSSPSRKSSVHFPSLRSIRAG